MPVGLILDIAYLEKVEPNWLYERMIEYEKNTKHTKRGAKDS